MVTERRESRELPSHHLIYGGRASTSGGYGARNVDQTNWRKRVQASRLKFCDDAKKAFLERFAVTNRITEAAQVAGVSLGTVHKHLDNDPDFYSAYEEAKKEYRDTLHRFASDLIFNGIQKPVIGGVHRDQIIAVTTEYPISLLQMELKRIDPDYKERQVVETSTAGGVVLIPSHMDTDDWIREQQEKNNLKDHPKDDG